MSPLQEQTLSWFLLALFGLTGVMALLVQIKILDASEEFRKWSLYSFIGAVALMVISYAKVTIFSSTPPLHPPIRATILPQGLDNKGLIKFKVSEAWLLETQSGGPERPGTTERIKKSEKQELNRIPPSQGPAWQVEIPANFLGSLVSIQIKDDTGAWWESGEVSTNTIDLKISNKEVPFEQTALFVPVAMAAENHLISQADMSSPGEYPKFSNYARPIERYDGRQYYEWRVFIDEPDEVLRQISDVRYLLHPSFPNRVQLRCDPSTKFSLQASGWGIFTIPITIRYKDKREVTVKYVLDLNKSWPSEALPPERPCD